MVQLFGKTSAHLDSGHDVTEFGAPDDVKLDDVSSCGDRKFAGLPNGSQIHFSSNPSEIKNGVTETATLLCSLNDTASSATVTGRRANNTRTDNDSVVDHTAVAELLSIVITRDAKQVAMVTHTQAASVAGGAYSPVVRGHVAKSEGFLELRWSKPSEGQAGEYHCEVNAMTSQGHVLTFTSPVSLEVVTPTLAEMLNLIRDLEATTKMFQANSEKLEAKVNQSELDRQSVAARISQLETKVINLGHYEMGTLHVLREPSFVSGSGSREKILRQDFKKPYNTPPLVFLSQNSFDAHKGFNIRYQSSIVSVDTKGFNMKFLTYADTVIYWWRVNWVSIPQ